MSKQSTIDGSKLKVQKVMCPTCPFRESEEALTIVRPTLIKRALGKMIPENDEPTCTPICHSTGSGAVEILRMKKAPPDKLCRGARNLQLRKFADLGFIEAPTDEAWDRKRKELGC